MSRRASRLVSILGVLAVALLTSLPATADPGVTTRVSVDSAGNQGNGPGGSPVISAGGRYVAFESEASNLVPGDTNGVDDVFVHDRQTGVTERVSVDSAGNQANGPTLHWGLGLSMSDDGRFVAMYSAASNLVPGDTNGAVDIFVRDRTQGTTVRVSVDSTGNQADEESWYPTISADGRYVAFQSRASNLVNGDTNGSWDVFVHDRDMDGDGIFDEAGAIRTERVSVDSTGSQGDADSFRSAVSATGRYVVFRSEASNLVPNDTNGYADVFVHDRQTGETERVSLDSEGNQANGPSYNWWITPDITQDGRYVAFSSLASNLVPGDTNQSEDVFVRDRQTGVTERVNVDSAGNQADADYEGGFRSLPPMADMCSSSLTPPT